MLCWIISHESRWLRIKTSTEWRLDPGLQFAGPHAALWPRAPWQAVKGISDESGLLVGGSASARPLTLCVSGMRLCCFLWGFLNSGLLFSSFCTFKTVECKTTRGEILHSTLKHTSDCVFVISPAAQISGGRQPTVRWHLQQILTSSADCSSSYFNKKQKNLKI